MKCIFYNKKGYNNLLQPFMNYLDKEFNLKNTWNPPIDIFETDSCYCIISELPGINKEEINLFIEGKMLILSGEKKEILNERFFDNPRFHRIERPVGAFKREILLPDYVSVNDLNVELKNGILEIVLKKAEKKVIKVK